MALYIYMFLQLVAGPIIRYDLIEHQILNRRESLSNISEGMLQFIYGLAKKVVIADYIAQVADNIFNAGMPVSVGTAWLGAIAYTLQIYFDFSGYSDMAIGLGRIFGFKFAENFNYPYISKSITEFWRRWHISLGSWFRDYVYIPLGGNRVSTARWIVNLLIVWSLTGIWHGANYTFWVWGMMFGYGSDGFIDNIFCYYLYNSHVILLLGVLLSTPIYVWLSKKVFSQKNFLWVESLTAIFLFLVTIVLVIGSSYHPFIYFNFYGNRYAE